MKQACETLTKWKEAHEAEKVDMEKERKEMQSRKDQARLVVESLQKAIHERDEHIQGLNNQANKVMIIYL